MAHRGEKARPSSSDDVMEQDGTTRGTTSFLSEKKNGLSGGTQYGDVYAEVYSLNGARGAARRAAGSLRSVPRPRPVEEYGPRL